MLKKIILITFGFFLFSPASFAGFFQLTDVYAKCTDVTVEYINASYHDVVHVRTSGDETALAPFCTAIIGKIVYLKNTHVLRDIAFPYYLRLLKIKQGLH
jgi:hypothetical protein